MSRRRSVTNSQTMARVIAVLIENSASLTRLTHVFSFTFGLTGAQLVHDLLDSGQDGQLAVCLVKLEPFDGVF